MTAHDFDHSGLGCCHSWTAFQIIGILFQWVSRPPYHTELSKWGAPSVVFKWPSACLHMLLTRGHQSGNWRKPKTKEVSNLISTCPTNPIQVLNLHEICGNFCLCPSNDTSLHKKKKNLLVLEPHGKDRKYPRDRATIGNPKVKIGCLPLTANHTSADCVKITLGPVVHPVKPYSTGVYRTEGFHALHSILQMVIQI